MDMTELYSYDKYKGYHIYVELDGISNYCAYVYHNGTCWKTLYGECPERLLWKCKRWVDEELR